VHVVTSSYCLERDGGASITNARITRSVANDMLQTKSLMKRVGILSVIEVTDIHIDIKDKDEIIESEFF